MSHSVYYGRMIVCENCKKMKAQLDAALDFLYTEMGWEYFRQEMLYHDDEKKKSASGENARKLRNFLVECGYRPPDSTASLELEEL